MQNLNSNGKSYFKNELLLKASGYTIAAKNIMDNLLSGLHKSKLSGFNIEFSEYKQFNTGDDVKYIDWKLYGKTEKLFMKKFEEESVFNASILLDISNSMGFTSNSSVNLSKLEYAKFTAACLIYKILQQNDYFEFTVFNDNSVNLIDTTNSLSIIKKVDDIFLKIEPSGKTDYLKVFTDYLSKLKKRKLLIIISDLISENKNINFQDIISKIILLRNSGNNVIFIQILDDAEINFNLEGISEFISMENDSRLFIDPVKIKEKYVSLMKRFLGNIETELLSNGIKYRLFNTSVDIEKNILKLFG
ncbi:DUF58 domain-containing protein [Candidatus Dependentiae bacterium]|nr:DUF58 domain-containing protein [Candidatus Dependentiae bacterium]